MVLPVKARHRCDRCDRSASGARSAIAFGNGSGRHQHGVPAGDPEAWTYLQRAAERIGEEPRKMWRRVGVSDEELATAVLSEA